MCENKECCCENNGKDAFLEELFSVYKPEKVNLILLLIEIQEHYVYVQKYVIKELS